MIAKVYSAIPDGFNGQIIEVESDLCKSLPTFNIVGMANKTISEARERVRAAILQSNLIFPTKKVTVNLAPAEVTKNGTHLDLPIALSILLLSKQLLQSDVDGKIFVGELSLTGEVRPIKGIINIVETAKQAGFDEVYLPHQNLPQASLISGINLIGVHNLSEIILHLRGIRTIRQHDVKNNNSDVYANKSNNPQHVVNSTESTTQTAVTDTTKTLLDHIRGQSLAKRALTIAIAGHHNILLSGPPGAGKTMLAHAAANLLPPPTPDEQITITKLHSMGQETPQIASARPFRAPHHTASSKSIIGGGQWAFPGEISLAHGGILFLDELPEFPRSVIEALRQPLEDHTISITRVNHRVTYPADFILIATMNPCPCGYLGDPHHECTCTQNQILNYRAKISGPILDRIDIIINISKIDNTELFESLNTAPPSRQNSSTTHPLHNTAENTHNVVKNNIIDCYKIQQSRYLSSGFYNGNLSSHQISTEICLSTSAKTLFQQATTSLNLSARAYYKILKIARTIADLDHSTEIKAEHISESISLRQQLL